jgi:hypothetical protein
MAAQVFGGVQDYRRHFTVGSVALPSLIFTLG